MLDKSDNNLLRAYQSGRALAALSTYNIEITSGICAAAEETGQPVILQAGSSAFGHAGRAVLAAASVAAARHSHGVIGVHLDHSRDLDEIRTCIEAGYTSVMVDGSHLPFADNVALTRDVVRLGHEADLWVEAELGPIPGEEDRSGMAEATIAKTDPSQAGEFVALTGVDCLAISIGNVHGLSKWPVHLDFERLAAIRDACPVPLVLHGASGLPNDQLRAAVLAGVAKVNINTELRHAFLESLAVPAVEATAALSIADQLGPARDAVHAAAAAKIRLLSGECVDDAAQAAPGDGRTRAPVAHRSCRGR